VIGLVLHLVAGPTHVVALTDQGVTLAWELPDLDPVPVAPLPETCFTLVAIGSEFRCITTGGDHVLDPVGDVRRGGQIWDGAERVVADHEGRLPRLMRNGLLVDTQGDNLFQVEAGAEALDLSPDGHWLATVHRHAGTSVARVVLRTWPTGEHRWSLALRSDPTDILFLDENTLLVRTDRVMLRVGVAPLPLVIEQRPVGAGLWAKVPKQGTVVVSGQAPLRISATNTHRLKAQLHAVVADPAGGLLALSERGRLTRFDPGPIATAAVAWLPPLPPGPLALGRRLFARGWWAADTARQSLAQLRDQLHDRQQQAANGSAVFQTPPGPLNVEIARLARHMPHSTQVQALQVQAAAQTTRWRQELWLWGVWSLLLLLTWAGFRPTLQRFGLGGNPLDDHGPHNPDQTPFAGLPVVQEVLLNLINNRVVVTTSDTGKVLLDHLAARLGQDGIGGQPVHVARLDLARCPEDEFWTRLAHTLRDVVGPFPHLDAPVRQAQLLRAFRKLGRTGKGHRVVLVLDHLDAMAGYDSVNQQFRGLLQTLPVQQLTVLAQALPGIGRGDLSPEESPWYNHFLMRPLDCLSAVETGDWLARRVSRPLRLEPGVADLVHDLSGGHPVRVWRCAQAMVDEALMARSRRVTPRHLLTAPGLVEAMLSHDRSSPGPGRHDRLLRLRAALGELRGV
jgi:hypothetical protein